MRGAWRRNILSRLSTYDSPLSALLLGRRTDLPATRAWPEFTGERHASPNFSAAYAMIEMQRFAPTRPPPLLSGESEVLAETRPC